MKRCGSGDKERKSGIFGGRRDGPTRGSTEPAGVCSNGPGCHVHGHVFLLHFGQLKSQARIRSLNGRSLPPSPGGICIVF